MPKEVGLYLCKSTSKCAAVRVSDLLPQVVHRFGNMAWTMTGYGSISVTPWHPFLNL